MKWFQVKYDFQISMFCWCSFAFEYNNINFHRFVIHDFLREWGVRRPSIIWCEGSRSVSHTLQFIDWIICLFCLNIFRNTCTWVFSKRLLFYFYFKSITFLFLTSFTRPISALLRPDNYTARLEYIFAAVANCWHYWVKYVEAKLKFNLQFSPQN